MDSPLRNRALVVALTVLAPVGWFLYLLLVPQANVNYQIGRFHVLVSWGNVALVPMLGFLALAVHLATGNRHTLALAWAALGFAAVFPLHRLFTAEIYPNTFPFYGPPARLVFAACFLVLAGPRPPAPPAIRRR